MSASVRLTSNDPESVSVQEPLEQRSQTSLPTSSSSCSVDVKPRTGAVTPAKIVRVRHAVCVRHQQPLRTLLVKQPGYAELRHADALIFSKALDSGIQKSRIWHEIQVHGK